MTPTFEVISLAPWVVFALIAMLLLANVWLSVRIGPGPKTRRTERKGRANPHP